MCMSEWWWFEKKKEKKNMSSANWKVLEVLAAESQNS